MAGSAAFGQKIKALRMARKLTDTRYTLRGFAEMVGISPTLLCKVEAGEFSIGVDKIKVIAGLLDYDADELLALANRVDPELDECIIQQPKAMALFLRTASGLSAEALNRLNKIAKMEADEEKAKNAAQEGGSNGTAK